MAATGEDRRSLVHDHVAVDVVEFEMRDVERAYGIHRGDDCAVAFVGAAFPAEFAAHLTQGTQNARAIEALSGTVFTKAHTGSLLDEFALMLGAA